MIISIDYDDTFTRDPDFWTEVVELARRRGHRVICVTSRQTPPFDEHCVLPDGINVICAGGSYKKQAAYRAGFEVDIWIDDHPGTIELPCKLQW